MDKQLIKLAETTLLILNKKSWNSIKLDEIYKVENFSVIEFSSYEDIPSDFISDDGNILSRSFNRNDCLVGKWTSGDFFEQEDLISNYYGNGILKMFNYKNKVIGKMETLNPRNAGMKKETK